ncbi:hypothetical protein [Streptomyces roseolilacinus]|uniref:hypothetical protein n=1 Tax=Streptomyces roseolilacinus TaxID=66904 RepID=UPI00380F8E49
MGSLRNPVGPLPSSIYWRRRAIVAAVVALLAVLIAWFVGFGNDGPTQGGDGANAGSPAPSITPGPSPSGPAISTQPGGRDGSGASGGSSGSGSGGSGTSGSGSGGSGTGGSGSGGSGSGAGGATGGGSGPGAGTGSGAGGQGGGSGSAQQVPAGSPLPNCAPGTLQLTLGSTEVSYAPDEKPQFRLTARNTSATGCKTDLGPATAVLTISDEGGDEVWSSKDCPKGPGSVYVAVPAGGTATYTIEWDRRHSAPRCATPPVRTAGPGTYLAEATVPGVKGVLRSSITLAKD